MHRSPTLPLHFSSRQVTWPPCVDSTACSRRPGGFARRARQTYCELRARLMRSAPSLVGHCFVGVIAIASACSSAPPEVPLQPCPSTLPMPNWNPKCDLHECRVLGKCMFDQASGKCSPATDADCAASTRCFQYGYCNKYYDGCFVTAQSGCQASAACKISGLCQTSGETCAPGGDADCQNSTGCKQYGACQKKGLTCAAVSNLDCANSAECAYEAKCAAANGVCAPSSDAACQASPACAYEGRCSRYVFNTDGWAVCVAPTGTKCQELPGCASEGLCFLDGNRCIAKETDHCVKSAACKKAGKCMLDKGAGRCIVPPAGVCG